MRSRTKSRIATIPWTADNNALIFLCCIYNRVYRKQLAQARPIVLNAVKNCEIEFYLVCPDMYIPRIAMNFR